MRWADALLRLLLPRRDRDAISGDLLEEYHEEILPARGPVRARLWYLRQIASFISPVGWGLVIGVISGVLNLLSTAIAPLADDSAGVMVTIVAVLFTSWAATAFLAAGPTGRFREALIAGALVGIATMAVVQVTAILRVNLFLGEISGRADWQNLLARYRASEFQSLRAYANYEYVAGTPLLLALGGGVGVIAGAIAGVISGATRKLRGLVRA